MIYINKSSEEPFYMQIYNQLKNGILAGTIAAEEKLPGIRSLAKNIGVGRNTVEKAYAQLTVEGYIEAKPASGFVVQHIGTNLYHANKLPVSREVISSAMKHKKYRYDFQYGGLPMDQFPMKLWKQYTSDALSAMVSMGSDQYQTNLGDDLLRQELRTYLYRSRGVICEENQIVISCGLPYCIEMICNLFARKVIAYEEPGYPGARDIFLKNNYEIKPIAADETGVDLSLLQKGSASAIYVTCSHQFPYGTVMSIQKRRQLLAWASESDSYIIEDDYDSEFRYDANPVPSLQSIDKDDRVIYIGTFSKALSPSMRVNFMILPKRLLPVFQNRYQSYACPVSWITQRILASLIQHEDYERHIRKMTLLCKKKHDTFIRVAEQLMGDRIKIYGKGSGLHFFIEVEYDDMDSLVTQAASKGVRIYPAKPFWHDPISCKENTLFLGYANLTEAEIEEGLTILNDSLLAVKEKF